MILGTSAVLINLLSLGLLAGVIIFCLLVLASPLLLALYRRSSPVEQKRLLLLSTALPWGIALLVMTAGMVEHLSETSMTSAIEPLIHWHHLDWFQFASWQGVLLITLGSWLILSLARYAVSLYQQNVFRKRFESLATPSQWGEDIYLLQQRRVFLGLESMSQLDCYPARHRTTFTSFLLMKRLMHLKKII
jgi:hypothetical protein